MRARREEVTEVDSNQAPEASPRCFAESELGLQEPPFRSDPSQRTPHNGPLTTRNSAEFGMVSPELGVCILDAFRPLQQLGESRISAVGLFLDDLQNQFPIGFACIGVDLGQHLLEHVRHRCLAAHYNLLDLGPHNGVINLGSYFSINNPRAVLRSPQLLVELQSSSIHVQLSFPRGAVAVEPLNQAEEVP